MDKISIIIPIHNASSYLAETIQSVKAQTYKNWELILVDDHSTDNSVKIAKQFTRLKKIQLIILDNATTGAAKARNAGIKAASGRYICFLDSDDLWKPTKLAKQVTFMREKNCAFSFTGYEFADKNGRSTHKIVRVPEKISYSEALKNTTISTITVMFDTTKLNKRAIYMPNVKSEDTATWWKILKIVDAYGLNESLSLYRRHGKTLSSNKLEAVRRIWNLYRNVECLNLRDSLYNFFGWGVNAVKRRV